MKTMKTRCYLEIEVGNTCTRTIISNKEHQRLLNEYNEGYKTADEEDYFTKRTYSNEHQDRIVEGTIFCINATFIDLYKVTCKEGYRFKKGGE